jgi:hypothetical protein
MIPPRSATRRRCLAGLALAALCGPASAGESGAGPIGSTLHWWSVPRPARVAARELAKKRGASVTKCVAIEGEDQVHYEIHASRRIGLFQRAEFVLTSVSEPKATAEKRREERTFRARMKRFRNAALGRTPRPDADPNEPTAPRPY